MADINVLFALLRSAISGKKLEEALNNFSTEGLDDLIQIASEHDIAHLVAFALKQNGLVSKDNTKIENHIFKAIYRYDLLNSEYEILCNTLEKAKIPFMPLKGSLIRKYYPEPWMRTSSDIDILIHEGDLEKAKSVLLNDCGYSYKGNCVYETSFIATNGVHIELHYNLVVGGYAKQVSSIQKDVWNFAKVKEGTSYFYEMTDEMFYFYHISHMAKHFIVGGCGIRFFIDLYVLDNLKEANKEKRGALLKRGNLLKFAEASRKLSCIWFSDGEYDSTLKQMEEYVLYGGLYGNMKNRALVYKRKKLDRIKSSLSRFFLPYHIIKFYYPILQKYPWLTPIMQIYRWFAKLFSFIPSRKKAKKMQYKKFSKNITPEQTENIQSLLDRLGL